MKGYTTHEVEGDSVKFTQKIYKRNCSPCSNGKLWCSYNFRNAKKKTNRDHNTIHLKFMEDYNMMRITARPTADMETRVPMQYLMTSYFAASNWALNAWIS